MAVFNSEGGHKKPLILIADDQALNQKALSLILDKLSYPSVLADDGADVLEKTNLHDVALIFMDLQMPKMDGCEAAKALRRRGFKKPIIAITASDFPEERENCLNAGIDDIMVKPCKMAEIEKTLLKWLDTENSVPQDSRVEVPENKAPAGLVFNAAELLGNFMNEKEMVLPLLSRFIERTQAQFQEMPELEKAGDWENARRLAHMIKGAALTMGGKELGNAAARLEKAYKNIDENEIKAAFAPAHEAFNSFKKEAESFLLSEG